MQNLDINLGEKMSLLNYLNPFKDAINSGVKIVDKAVLDKDASAELQAAIKMMELTGSQQIESSYQVALSTKTHWFFDGVHKLGRQALSLLVLLASYSLVDSWIESDVAITFEHVLLVTSLGGPTALYTVIKGRGKP